MSSRLGNLMARNLSGSFSLRARTPSLFEPLADDHAPSPAAPIPRPGRSREFGAEEGDWVADQPDNFPVEEQDFRATRQFDQAVHPARKGEKLNPDRNELSIDLRDSMLINEDPQPSLATLVRNPVHVTQASSSPAMSSRSETARDRMARETSANSFFSPTAALPGRADEETDAAARRDAGRPLAGDERQTAHESLIGKAMNIVGNRKHEPHEGQSFTRLAKGNQGRADGNVMPLPREERHAVKSAFPQPAAEPEPSIQVTIGRIEIRTERESSTQRKPERPSPVMSLDEYLRQKNTRVRQ